ALAERGVRETEAEREERLDVLRVVPAVADLEALRIRRVRDALRVVHAGELLRRLRGQVLHRLRERLRQLRRRVHVAEQERREGVAILLARIPGLENGLHPVEP